MVEEADGRYDPQEVVKAIVRSTGSDEFKKLFRQLPKDQRVALARQLAASSRDLTTINTALVREEKARLRRNLGLKTNEASNRVVERLFRGKDGYLNFEALDASRMAFLPHSARQLLGYYRNHVVTYGQDSIAHLCLSPYVMQHLATQGFFLAGDTERVGPITTNTIDEVRGLLERLSSSPDLRICRKKERSGSLASSYFPIYNMRQTLVNKLEGWDEIRTQFQATAAS